MVKTLVENVLTALNNKELTSKQVKEIYEDKYTLHQIRNTLSRLKTKGILSSIGYNEGLKIYAKSEDVFSEFLRTVKTFPEVIHELIYCGITLTLGLDKEIIKNKLNEVK